MAKNQLNLPALPIINTSDNNPENLKLKKSKT